MWSPKQEPSSCFALHQTGSITGTNLRRDSRGHKNGGFYTAAAAITTHMKQEPDDVLFLANDPALREGPDRRGGYPSKSALEGTAEGRAFR